MSEYITQPGDANRTAKGEYANDEYVKEENVVRLCKAASARESVDLILSRFATISRKLPSRNGWIVIAALVDDEDGPATFREIYDWATCEINLEVSKSSLREAIDSVCKAQFVTETGGFRRAGSRGPKQRLYKLDKRGQVLVNLLQNLDDVATSTEGDEEMQCNG